MITHTNSQDWEKVINNSTALNYIIQEVAVPQSEIVISCNDRNLSEQSMFHTCAVYMMENVGQGLFSRVSSDFITNIGVSGFLQPIIIKKGC